MAAEPQEKPVIHPVNYLSIKPLPVDFGEPPVSDLLAHGQPVGVSVGGAVLEAAFATHDYCVLFMTDDVPYEEGLTIHLLTRDYRYVESAGLAWPYAAGAFRYPQVTGERSIQFRFFDFPVVLEILPRPQFRIPFVPDFVGVFRPFGFTRHMRLRRGYDPHRRNTDPQ